MANGKYIYALYMCLYIDGVISLLVLQLLSVSVLKAGRVEADVYHLARWMFAYYALVQGKVMTGVR